MSASVLVRAIPSFWTRQFAFYLMEHRNPLNRATHMVGIPLLVASAIYGIAVLDWRIVVGGQVIGWAFQLLGHRIEGNKPALLKNPISFLVGPLMVLVEILELVGIEFSFATEARRAVGGN